MPQLSIWSAAKKYDCALDNDTLCKCDVWTENNSPQRVLQHDTEMSLR